MHLGNARTALFNALAAVHDKGTWVLRIEDTDEARSSVEFADDLMADLHTLSLFWQEGPGPEGEHGPYWQSKRKSIYDTYYVQLEEQDLAYPCFCSEMQLEMTRKMQRRAGQPPRYPGTCRNLTGSEIEEKLASGATPTLRFKVPAGEVVEYDDLVRGRQRFQTDDIGDFIIRRADRTASFMFCNAVDDALMGVTLALRGEDHLTNTPRQLMILRALALTPPAYGHISLILGSDGAPLSKRNGSRSIRDLITEGYFPLALVNYLARLGRVYANDTLQTFEELAAGFDHAKLVKSAARYDEQQLLFWQKQAMQEISVDALWSLMPDIVKHTVPQDNHHDFTALIKPNITFVTDAATWAHALFADTLDFDDEARGVIKTAGKVFYECALETVQSQGADFKMMADAIKSTCGVKGKQLFQPLRIALTGLLHGPEMGPLVKLMGSKRVINRINQALDHC